MTALRNFMEITLKYRAGMVIKVIAPFMKHGQKVLDIGCGNGVVSDEIRGYFGCALTGTDIMEYLKRDMPFKKMPALTSLPFADKEFDTGLLIDVLHHIPFDMQLPLVREARRVCRDILIFEVEPTFLAKAVDVLANLIHNARMPLCLTHRTADQWVELFEHDGMKCTAYPVPRPALWASTNNLICLKA